MTLRPVTETYAHSLDDRTSAPAQDSTREWLAGGTDLITLARTGIVELQTVVDIKAVEAPSRPPSGITRTDDGWVIGALTTLAELDADADLSAEHPAIREAVSQSATLQIRHRATIGGNLLQRPRCSYFRDATIDCWMKGGTDCPAKVGRNEHHALIDEPCIATQPSDLASVLVALDATASVRSHDGTDRTIAVRDLLARPTADRRRLHTLRPGETITSVTVPGATNTMSTYLKAMDRATWQFALVGIATVVQTDEAGTVVAARLVASGVDSAPHELTASADALCGEQLSAAVIDTVAGHAADDLVPQSDNDYKRALLRGLVRRSLERLTD